MIERVELRASYARLAVAILFGIMCGATMVVPSIGVRIASGTLAVAIVTLGILSTRGRLTLDETGITARGMFGTKQMAWTELDHYTFWSMDQQTAYVAGAQGGLILVLIIALVSLASRGRGADKNRRFSQGRLTIVSKTGERIHLDRRWHKPVEALEPAFQLMHEELRARAVADYAPFTLNANELVHEKKGTLGLSDIEKVTIATSTLSIKKRDKRFRWVAMRMAKIHNSVLFMHELGERGLVVDAKRGTFVPQAVLETLRASTARQGALPAARLIRR
ncbi:hypothetical protein BH11MYX1_BH11MYX1_24810 [soil metagenome]